MTASASGASGVRLVPTPLDGLHVVESARRGDARGWLERVHDAATLAGRDLFVGVAQTTISHSATACTVRGLDYLAPPHEEVKLVRCVRGAAFDVAVDLRPGSPTRGRWHAVELTPDNGRALYIPAGIATAAFPGSATCPDGGRGAGVGRAAPDAADAQSSRPCVNACCCRRARSPRSRSSRSSCSR